MVDQPDPIQRAVLPIPQQRRAGPAALDAKDPERDVPAHRAAAAAGGRAQRPDRAARRRRLRRLQRLRRAVQHADVREARGGRPEVQPLPHHGALLADAPGAADGPQPPLGRHGRHHGDRHLRAGLQLHPARHARPRWRRRSSSTATRPRSSASATRCPCGRRARSGPFHAWPTGSGFEHFYGFIGGETNQYAPAIYQDTVPIEPDRTAEEGYHFTEDMTDHAISWIHQQKALAPDKPFFVYYAPGATHAPHHVPTEWSDRYKGRVRRRLGRAARADAAAPDRARRGARGRRADGAAAGDPGLGRDARRPQAGAGAPDGGLRRLPGAHRPPRRAAGRRARRPRRPRRHADLRDHRRQRRVRRGHAARHVQRAHGR